MSDAAPAATEAPPLGFWSIAAARPEHLALVDPDGHEVSAGELLASTNQLVHGLRALGLQQGDAVAMLLPNGREVFELYLAVLQAGLYLVPINWHLVGPEIAYIVEDSDAKALFCTEKTAALCRQAADSIHFPEARRFSTSNAPGFRPYAELTANQPDHLPGGPVQPQQRAGGGVGQERCRHPVAQAQGGVHPDEDDPGGDVVVPSPPGPPRRHGP